MAEIIAKQLALDDLVADDQQRTRMKAAWNQRVRTGQAPTLASRGWLMAPLYQPSPDSSGVYFWNNEHCRSREVPKVWARAIDEKGLGLPEILDRDILCFALWRMIVTGNRTIEIGLTEFRDFLVPASKRPMKMHYEAVIRAVQRLEANEIAWGTGFGDKDLEGETLYRGYALESASVPNIAAHGQRIGSLPVRMTISQSFIENMVERHEWQYVCFRQYLSLALSPIARRLPIARQVFLYVAANCKAMDENQGQYVCAFDLEDLQYRYEHLTRTRLKTGALTDRMVPRYRDPKNPQSRLGKVFKALGRAGVLLDFEVRQFRNLNQLVCAFHTDWGTQLAVQTNFIDRMAPRLSPTAQAIGALPPSQEEPSRRQGSKPDRGAAHAAERATIPERLQPIVARTAIYPSIVLRALAEGWSLGQMWRSQVTALYDYAHDIAAQGHELGAVAARRVTHKTPHDFKHLADVVKSWARKQPWFEAVGGVVPTHYVPSPERPQGVDIPTFDAHDAHDIVVEAVTTKAPQEATIETDTPLNQANAQAFIDQVMIVFDYANRSPDVRKSFDLWVRPTQPHLIQVDDASVLITTPTPLFARQLKRQYGSYIATAVAALGWPPYIDYSSS